MTERERERKRERKKKRENEGEREREGGINREKDEDFLQMISSYNARKRDINYGNFAKWSSWR
jgi:hypothetical protein